MRLHFFVLAASILIAPFVFAQDQQAESLKRLPPPIKGFLDKKFPGWTFAQVQKSDVECYDQETKLHPSLTWGDFNADGQVDYALKITHGRKQYLLEFLSHGTTFSAHVLHSGPIPNYSEVLFTEKKGEQTVVSVVAEIDDLYVGACGVIGIRYVFHNGRITAETPPD